MRVLKFLAWMVVGLVAAVAALLAAVQTDPGKRLLAGVISDIASTPDQTVRISGIDGLVPTDVTVARVTLSDRDGAWLEIEDAGIRWSLASLLQRHLRIERVSARRIEVRRPPLPAQQPPPPTSDGEFSLPLDIDLASLEIGDLHLGAAIAGVESRWKVGGSAALSARQGQSRVQLALERIDGPKATLSATLSFNMSPFSVDGEVALVESTAGGVVATLLERPGLEQTSLRLIAKGNTEQGTIDLTSSAGDALSSDGSVRWQRQGNDVITSFRLSATSGVADGPFAPLRGKPVTLEGEATLDGAGVLTVKRAVLELPPAKVTATARYDRSVDRLEAKAEIDAPEAGPFSPFAGQATWRDLKATLTAEMQGLARQPTGTITIAAAATDPTVPALAERLPKGRVEMNARLALRPDGQIVVEALEASSPLAKVDGTGSYTLSTGAADVRATIDLPALASFSALAGAELAGHGRFEVTARLQQDGLRLTWQGNLEGLGLPDVPPHLLQPALRLEGSAALQKDNAWSVEGIRLSSEGATVRIDGRGRDRNGQLKMSVSLPQLDRLRPGVTGNLDITTNLDVNDMQVHGDAQADGTVMGQPLAFRGRFERDADGALSLPSVQGNWASASVDVRDLEVSPSGATGSGHLRIARLQDFAALAGTDMAGVIDLDIATDPQATGKVRLALKGENLRAQGIGAGSLKIDASVTDPFGAAGMDGKIEATRLSGVEDISRLDATVKGDRRAFDVTLRATGGRTNADVAARIEQATDEIKLALSRLQARYRGLPIVLAAPARLRINGERTTIEAVALQIGAGRVRINGAVDPNASDLEAEITAFPLALLEALTGASGIEGTLQAKLRVRGSSANPRIDATYSAAGLRLRRPNTALVPALALQGSATVVDRQASLDARITAGGGTNLSLKAKAGLPQGRAPLTAKVDVGGTMDLGPFAPMIGNDIRNVSGTLRPNLSIDIAGTRITGSGSAALTGVGLYLPASGLRLAGGEGLFVLEGDTLRLQRLNFQAGQGSQLSSNGTVRLDPAQGFPMDLSVVARRLLAVSRPDLVATVSSDVKVTGSTMNGIEVSGRITIDRAEIAIGASQAPNFPTVAVREINLPAGATPGAAPPPPPRQLASATPQADPVRLALTVEAPQAVFVRGRGLDAEMGGQLQVTGNPEAPTVLGSLKLRRGDFNLAGRRLVFSRGEVSLENANTIDPRLDFVATATVQSTTISVALTGTSRAPKIAVTSDPPLPQDEAMAMLLFGKPAAGLSAFEILTAAQSLADLAGGSSGATGFWGRLRQGLGLDRLSVESGSSGPSNSGVDSVALGAGRYVAPGVYVGAKQGAGTSSTRGVVEIEVLRNTKVEADIGADANSRLGVKMEWDY